MISGAFPRSVSSRSTILYLRHKFQEKNETKCYCFQVLIAIINSIFKKKIVNYYVNK
jgi:hypothetical protein